MSTPEKTEDRDPFVDQPTETRTTHPLPEVLKSPRTKLVCLYLRIVTEARVEDMKRTLDMKALTLYPILDILIDHEFVERTGNTYVITMETRE